MADYIDDNELDELNEAYEQKLREQKHRGKKAKAPDGKAPSEGERTKQPVKKSEPSDKSAKERPAKKEPSPKAEKAETAEKPSAVKHESKAEAEQENASQADGEKKEKNRNIPHIVSIIICGTVFFSAALMLLILPRPTESELEHRRLTEFPTFSWEDYWSGKYNEQISEYYNDTIPYRDDFKRLGAAFRSLFGINLQGNSVVGPVEQIKPDESEPEVTTASTKPIVIVTPAPKDENSSAPESTGSSSANTESTPAPESTTPKPQDAPAPEFTTPSDPDAQVLMSEASNIVYRSGGELYAGTLYNGNRENAEYFAATVSALKNAVNANVYYMPILTQNTFVTPTQLNGGTYTEKEDATYLSNLISKDVKVVDIFDALAKHANEDIYFKRDTHWQQLGAYYAAAEFAKSAGVEYAPLNGYTEKQRDSIGSIYTFTQFEGLEGAYETFTYYIPPNEFTVDYYDADYQYLFTYPLMPENDYSANGFYSLYMVADDYIKHITTDVKNGKKLVVLKDDYLSAAVPCLTSSFEEIFVIDVRHCNFNVADFINEQGATDVLFGLTISNSLGEVGSYLDYLQN